MARSRVLGSTLAPVVAEVAAVLVDSLDSGSRDLAVAEIGAGTGQYLSSALSVARRRGRGARGVALDLSKSAARMCARADPEIAGVVADAWSRLPLRSDAFDGVLSVFAPRNFAEFARVLAARGVVVVVAPAPAHLSEIIEPMQMLRVGDNKADRLGLAVADLFAPRESHDFTYQVSATAAEITDIVAMGPSAFHMSAPEIAERAAVLAPEPVTLTVSVNVSVFEVQRTAS